MILMYIIVKLSIFSLVAIIIIPKQYLMFIIVRTVMIIVPSSVPPPMATSLPALYNKTDDTYQANGYVFYSKYSCQHNCRNEVR